MFRLAAEHPGLPGVGARTGTVRRRSAAGHVAAGAREGAAADERRAGRRLPRRALANELRHCRRQPSACRDPARGSGNPHRSRRDFGPPAPADLERLAATQIAPPPAPVAAAEPIPAAPQPAQGTSGMDELPEMPVMPPSGPATDPATPTPAGRESNEPAVSGESAATGPALNASRAEPTVLRTADQLHTALAGAKGGLLRVPADATWDLSDLHVQAAGNWRIEAEPGTTRPKLRFLAPAAGPGTSTAWSAMLDVRAGTLHLEGVDVVLPRGSSPREGRWAAFALGPAAGLSLTGCTITVEDGRAHSAVVAVEAEAATAGTEAAPEEAPASGANAEPPAGSTVRVNDSLIRAGGDLVDVAGGRRLTLDVDNSAVATGGSFMHGHGSPRGNAPAPLNLVLRQVTALTAGGLVLLDSTPGTPALPVADIHARHSVLSTGPNDGPLIRVDGQDDPASMRDRIVWQGLGVGYHHINTYRRDESAQVGVSPTLYPRPSWLVALGAREQSPVHGDLKFRHEWESSRPAWALRRDDLSLRPDSPAHSAGADFARLPDPPG